MNDLDERLREDFAQLISGPPPELGFDTEALLGAGRRLQRSRAIRRGLGGAVVAALAIVVGWAGLTSLGTSTAPVVPAAPAPSQAWIDNPAYFDLHGLALDATTDFRKVTLAVTPAASGWDVRADLSSQDGVLLATSTFHAGAEVTVHRLSPQVVVALLPTATNWWDVAMGDPTKNPAHSDSMRPGTLDVTAILLTFDTAKQADDLAGFIWQASDGSLIDSLGNQVATSTVTLQDRTVTLYWDDPLHRLGFRLPNGLSTAIHTGARWDWPAFPRLQYSERTPADDSATWVLADMLPTGARDLNIDLVPTRSAWTTTTIAGRTAYVIVTTADTSAQPIRSLRYLDENGRTVTYHR